MKIKINIWTWLLFMALAGTVHAHPDSGFLPDAIAETEYRIVIELDPHDIETRNKLGIVLYRKDKLDEALKQFKAVLTLKPGDFNAHDGIGLVMMKQGRYEDAVIWFKKAITLNKTDAMVYYHLGSAYKAEGDIKNAALLYEKALTIEKNDTVLEELTELNKKINRESKK